MTLRIDHVVYAVADLEAAATTMQERHGLASVVGGRHLGWGTGNRIIPLGDSYLELLSVVDHQEASLDSFGQSVARHLQAGDGPFLWVLSTDDLDGVAARLGLEVVVKSRLLPGGGEIAWRSAGLPQAAEKPWLPFFISWDVPPADHPGRMPVQHTTVPAGIAWVEVGTPDPEATAQLADWLGGEDLPVRLQGPPGVNGLGVAVAGGEIAIRTAVQS